MWVPDGLPYCTPILTFLLTVPIGGTSTTLWFVSFPIFKPPLFTNIDLRDPLLQTLIYETDGQRTTTTGRTTKGCITGQMTTTEWKTDDEAASRPSWLAWRAAAAVNLACAAKGRLVCCCYAW